MNVRKIINQILVEWDEEKNQINLRKHRIDFPTAALVFSDQLRIEIPDERHNTEEERIQVIGNVGKILVVVYVQREEYSRIISARVATKTEKEAYYGY